ncbi:MAG TPA: phosphatidylglycerol lysyltransferase domain-containing protein, partial [Niastella sp.]
MLAIVFFRNERKELQAIIPQLRQARVLWLLAGLTITFIYIFFEGGMYRKSFAAIGLKLKWAHAIILFLKRNFVSVFLPAGGFSSLAYSPSQIRKEGFRQPQVHQASGLFAFAGLLTVFIAGLPIVIYTVFVTSRFKNALLGLLASLFIITLIVIAVRSIKQKKRLYRWIDKKIPSFTPTLNEVFATNVNLPKFSGAVAFSIGVELCGMVHLYIAMLALGVPASFGASAAVYIISVLMRVLSPFLRGLGAVEISMIYGLQQFGYNEAQALSITILYRVFEFWLPLIAGFIALSWKARRIFLRVAPVLLCFALGIVNIVSVIVPPIHNRTRLLREYLPLTTIHASHLLVLLIGLTLLGTSAFLFRGLRNAWIIALSLSFFSLIGHLTKALDYVEAIFSGLTLIVFITTASQYRIRSSSKWMQAGLKTAIISFAAVALFGFLNFYFIKPRHFGVDFTWQESLVHTIRSLLLLADDPSLHPVTRFAHELIWLIKALGFFTWAFLLFTLIKPHVKKYTVTENYRERALFLLKEFGNSAIDHFKVYKYKLFFFSEIHEAFVAYRISGGFAIVLEEPVCAEEYKVEVLLEFDRQCRKMGLKPAFYRVDESSVLWFSQLKKRKLIIGQEAILNINEFTLEGRGKKSLRNGLNSLQKKGYTVSTQSPPHTSAFLAELKKISDEWLKSFGKEELIFSQGMFDEKELMQDDVIVVKDADGVIKAFLNVIPDYAEEECTYDLIRKTNDAPPAVMDALIIQLITYAKERGQLYVNLGLVPMLGIGQPDNTAEQIIKLAAEKIKRFQHYKGLREFKEKYATLWENKYLVY